MSESNPTASPRRQAPIIEGPPWRRFLNPPRVELDEDTERLLASMVAVGVQLILLFSGVAAAVRAYSLIATLTLLLAVTGLALLRLGRLPFRFIPGPESVADIAWWTSTRRYFLLAQVGLALLAAGLITLIARHAGRDTLEVAWRWVLQGGLAVLFGVAYRVP